MASRWTAADVAATGLPVSRTSPSGLARASTCAHAPLPTRAPACGQVRARPRPQAPTRTRARTPNRWEQSYYDDVLAPRIAAGEILAAHYEALTLRIGRCRYTADWCVQLADGRVELHEVKGFMREAARVRMSAVTEMYPALRLVVATGGPGKWRVREWRRAA